MVLPLWRSLHSLNLMLPKEDRRAMLLRLYNDDSMPINNSIAGRQQGVQAMTPDTPAETGTETEPEAKAEAEDSSTGAALAEAEENAMEKENEALGQDQQEQTDIRETWTKAGDEEDRFNTTV